MTVRFQIFKSSFKKWPNLCQEAADFASSIPDEHLISISHSCDYTEGTVVVWYHDK